MHKEANMKKIILENKNNTLMIAHRGYSAMEKENTIASFIAAGNQSFYGMECDVHRTKDGKYVICHDANIKRVSGIDLEIKNATFEELSKIELLNVEGTKTKSYYRIPLLKDYLEIAKRYQKHCVIELKYIYPEEDLDDILAIIQEVDYLKECTFISFYPENIRALRHRSSTYSLQILLGSWKDEYLPQIVSTKCDVDINYQELTPDILKILHENGVKVNIWTVNDVEIAKNYIDLGIDYITTNLLQ